MKKVFQCQVCGEKFEADVLSPEQKQELEQTGRRGRPVICPNCGSGNLTKL